MSETQLAEPDELELLQLSAARAKRRLIDAPGLVAWIRLQVTPGMGGKSDGMPRAASRTPPAPLRVDAVDDADAVYAQLLDWASYWAEQFDGVTPTLEAKMSPAGEPVGFRAGTSPERAGMLVRNLVQWLLGEHGRIAVHHAAVDYFDDVSNIIRSAENRYPRRRHKDRGVVGRRCPVCGEWQVHAVWGSEDVRDVVVKCEHCGNVIEAKTYRKILDWIA